MKSGQLTVLASLSWLLEQITNSSLDLGCSCGCACRKGDPGWNSGENPHPIISVDYGVASGQEVPELFKAQLNFGGILGPEVWYRGDGVQAGEPLRFLLQADATPLATGFYPWTLTVTAYRNGQGTPTTFSGSHAVFNRINSPYGNRWWIPELDFLQVQANGVGLIRGDSTAGWFARDANGSYIAPQGSYSHLVQNADGTFTLTYPDNVRQHFSPIGLLTSRVDASGNTTTYQYVDANGDGMANELESITNPFGQQITYAYQNGRLVSKTDHETGQVITYEHDANGRLRRVAAPDPDGPGPLPAPETLYTYNALGLMNGISKYGATTHFVHDFASRFDTAIDADGRTWSLDPEETQGLVDLSTGLGTQQNPAPVFRPQDSRATYVDELGETWRIRTDGYGHVLEATDPLGNFTRWERDANGRVLLRRDPDPDGAGPLAPPITRNQYDPWGNLVRVIRPDGTTLDYGYQAGTNRLLWRRDELQHPTSYGYDAAGNLISQMDALGNATFYYYTSRGQVSQITYPDPDGVGPQAAPNVWFEYDSRGNLIKFINPDGSFQEFHYTNGNLDWRKDELGFITTYAYDDVGRLIQTTDPHLATTHYDYNDKG